jgi:signal transduction histidine kinase
MQWPDADRIVVPLDTDGCLLARSVLEQRPLRTVNGCGRLGRETPACDFCLEHAPAFVAVPLVVKGEARGAIYVDNRFREREVGDEDIQVLMMFASEAGLAMENATLYESLEGALRSVRDTQDKLLQHEKLAALGEMAAKIAHEIKNPLTVIGGFAGRIARKGEAGEADQETVARYATIIRKEVQRLERIVQQTLHFSREATPKAESLDLNAEIREVLAMFRDELDESRVTTVFDFSEELPLVQADPDQIRQVLWNLVSNAVQVMEGGGMLTLSTRPSAPAEGDGVVFGVSDTGGGIPHDVVHNIFNPFFTTKPKGTGLGLPIVHAIVERHGGSIHIDNREGKGVTFSVVLPRIPREPGAGTRLLDLMRKGEANGSDRPADP